MAYFRNQGSVVSFMADLMATHFGLTADPTLPTLRNINTAADAYPRKRLLDYLSGKAPNYERCHEQAKLELTWIGKEKRPKLEPRILREEPDKSYHAKQRVTENDIFDNRLIFGDNLLALKALEAEFAGKVKCVFIDPPYNTGSAFKQYDDGLEHSIWLGLMRDRLEIIRRLLADDGSLWITIDDNEAQYLKVLCDEVFGRACFVTTFIWKKVDSPNDNKVPITPDHEYLLCFTKTPGSRPFRQKYDDSILAAYRKPDAESDRPYRDRLLKKNGKNSLRSDRPSMFFPLTAPDGTEVLPIHDDGREARWAMGKTSVEDLIEKRVDLEKARNRLDSLYPSLHRIVHRGLIQRYGMTSTQHGKPRRIKRHCLRRCFDTPEDMLKRILICLLTPETLSSIPLPALEPQARSRTRWAFAGSWWNWESTATRTSFRACRKSSPVKTRAE